MNTKNTLRLVAVAAALPLLAQDPLAQDKSLTLVGGPQLVNQGGLDRGEARFKEFRDVGQGFALEFGRFDWTPKDGNLALSLTAVNAGRRDQRYVLDFTDPAKVSFQVSYVERPRFYSSGSRTLWSGAGTGSLTLGDAVRTGIESAAGSATSPLPATGLTAYMQGLLGAASPFDLESRRKDLTGEVDLELGQDLTLSLKGAYGKREGTRPLGFGTYIRRQALSGVAGTGPGFFWRETVEARGSELIEPLDHAVTEGGVTLTWARKGHTLSAGWLGSFFRNDITALYFDNPFEGPAGRASSTVFSPASDQEPGAPAGNNALRGLYARSSTQLWPNNDYSRLFATASFKLGASARLSGVVARATMKQDDPFLPYAESDQVVFSQAGQPLVLARDAPLPQASLDGKMTTTQADLKATAKLGPVSARAGLRHYELEDGRPGLRFPGYSSSGDSYFRRGIGQTLDGQKALYNILGGYTRRRADVGVAVRAGGATFDAEYAWTDWDYAQRQVDRTAEDAFRGTVRFMAGGAGVSAFYLHSRRDYEGRYAVGLETSGVRAYDVWRRDRDQAGLDVDVPLSDELTLACGGSYAKDEYPGAVAGFAYGYGLQDTTSGALHAGLTWTRDEWVLGARAGYDRYEWRSLQVTKTSQGADYNPINRWTRDAADDVFWVGAEVVAPVAKGVTLRGDLTYQAFTGDWATANLAAPDVNSAVAYPFPELKDRTFSLRASLLWEVAPKVTVEGRYWFEPYRLEDFTWDALQPYMQGVFKETRGSAGDVGDMNVSRFLFLDSRYGDYTAHVLSAFVHLRF
jgi:hypothetical protein